MTAPVAAGRAALPLADDCCAPLMREPLTQALAAILGGTAPPGVVTGALWPAATGDRTSS